MADDDLGYVLDEDIVPALWTADELSSDVADDKTGCISLNCWSPSSNAKHGRRNLGLIVSSLSNLVIAYNFGIIDLALHNMADAYPTTQAGWADSAVASSVFAGAVIGQLCLGYAGDRLGRRRALLLTLGLVFWSALATALLTWGQKEMYYLLSAFRFTLGVGVGGLYPLSAVACAESTGHGVSRERRAGLAFTWQAGGAILAPLIVYLLLRAGCNPRVMWRIFLAVGAVPTAMVLRAVYVSAESLEYGGAKAQGHVSPTLKQQLNLLSRQLYFGPLLGCAMSWFCLDVTFYSLWIFTPTIVGKILLGGNTSAIDTCAHQVRIAGYTALVNCLTIPGLLLSAYFVADDRLGPKWLQVLGFALIALVLGVLGFVYEPLQSHDGVLMLVFCIASLVINFGPGTTTYVLPQRIFPVEVRSTANGIAAAAGKIGSFIATAGFKPLVAAKGLPAVFFVCCGISALGMVITHVLVPESAVADREGLELRSSLSRPSLATSSLFTRDTSVREDFPDLHTLRNPGHLRSASHEQALAQVKGVVARADPVSGLL